MADDKNLSSDEDYLDSLLNAVTTTEKEDVSSELNGEVGLLEDMLTDDFLSDDLLDGFVLDEADLFDEIDEIDDIDLSDELDDNSKNDVAQENIVNNDMTEESASADSFVVSEDNNAESTIEPTNIEQDAEAVSDTNEDVQELFDMLGGDFDSLEEPVLTSMEPVANEEPQEEIDSDFSDLLENIALGNDELPEPEGDSTSEETATEAASANETVEEQVEEPAVEQAEEPAMQAETGAESDDAFGGLALDDSLFDDSLFDSGDEAVNSDEGANSQAQEVSEASNSSDGESNSSGVAAPSEGNVQDKPSEEEKPKKKGFLAKLFGKKEKAEEAASDEGKDENEKILEEMDAASLDEELESLEERKPKKEKKKKEKKEKKPKEKKEKKPKEKKEKPPKPKEEIIYIPIPVYILMLTCAIGISVVLLYSGKDYSYKTKLKYATNAFVNQNYSKAYDQLQGVKMKSDDQEFYDQVEIIMYVYKQVESYEAHRAYGDYYRALDSLMKGVNKYDVHLSKATELGVAKDMKYVVDIIEKKLKYDYDLSLDEARVIFDYSNGEYSQKLTDITNDSLEKIQKNIEKENKKKTRKTSEDKKK